MRVAVVAVEANKSGGVERYAYELVRALGAELFASRCELHFHKITRFGEPDLLSKNLFPLMARLSIKENRFDVIHSLGASYLSPHISTAVTSQPAVLQQVENDEIFSRISPIRKIYWKLRCLIPFIMETGFTTGTYLFLPSQSCSRQSSSADIHYLSTGFM